jgi:hypothetical protein
VAAGVHSHEISSPAGSSSEGSCHQLRSGKAVLAAAALLLPAPAQARGSAVLSSPAPPGALRGELGLQGAAAASPAARSAACTACRQRGGQLARGKTCECHT